MCETKCETMNGEKPLNHATTRLCGLSGAWLSQKSHFHFFKNVSRQTMCETKCETLNIRALWIKSGLHLRFITNN